ncbi:MAG TPA: hypothetical protein VMC10_19940 [Stellaceae bacterium]|nr:hypothetical protein [Stellaceae bacterium]
MRATCKKAWRAIAAVAVAALLWEAPVMAQTASAGGERLGEVHFPISCSAASQQAFDRATAMLHNFMYPRTVAAYSAITAAEPGCAMAYWGIAISERPNPLAGPFPESNLQKGWEAIEKARAAKTKTQRESDWIEAMATFYQDYTTVDQKTRSANYESAMERLHARYPDDTEAAIFYALALDENVDLHDKTYAKQLKAGAILEQLMPRLPNHPGIPHYIIHSYDYRPLAERALPAAVRYAELAPSSPHALHVPSHIFSMLGMWPDVVSADTAADHELVREAEAENPKVKPAAIAGRYHSLDFLENAYLQMAQDKKAKEIVDIRNSVPRLDPEARYRAHTAFAAIPVRYALERGDWTAAAKLDVPETPYPQAEALAWFGRALGAAQIGDLEGAKLDEAQLVRLKGRLVAAKDSYWAGQVEIEARASLAWINLLSDHKAEAIHMMENAADLEDASENHIAMENRLVPMRELLGELLLKAKEPAKALRQFEMSLAAAPNRYRSLAGAAKAAEALGDRKHARAYYQKLLAVCSSADTERPDLVAARSFLAKN